MQLINQSYEILGTPKSVKEAWEFAAKAARTCYQSEKVKLDESEEDFCKRILIKHKDDMECNHMSPLEFGALYFTVTIPSDNWCYRYDYPTEDTKFVLKYYDNKFSKVAYTIADNFDMTFYISTNLRVIYENGWQDDLQYVCEPTKEHKKFWIFKLTTCLHVYKDLTRHRTLSYDIESTRFCNYLKEKFGASITFVKLPWVKPEEEEEVKKDLETIENIYFKWINKGWTAQQAAEFLVQCVKGEVMFGGFEDNLKHMFRLRAEECSGPVHPLVAEIIKPLYRDYLKFIKKFNLNN